MILANADLFKIDGKRKGESLTLLLAVIRSPAIPFAWAWESGPASVITQTAVSRGDHLVRFASKLKARRAFCRILHFRHYLECVSCRFH
jgi:hypothetical protein